MVKRSTPAKRRAPAKRPANSKADIAAAAAAAGAAVVDVNQEGQVDGKAQQEGTGGDSGTTPQPQPPVEEAGNPAASQGDNGTDTEKHPDAATPDARSDAAQAVRELEKFVMDELVDEQGPLVRVTATTPDMDGLAEALQAMMPSAEDLEQMQQDLVICGYVFLRDGKRINPADVLYNADGKIFPAERQGDEPVDMTNLDINAVAANTAQAAAAEIVMQLVPKVMDVDEDGTGIVDPRWDPEQWVNGCCTGPSVDGDVAAHEILSAYAASRPSVVTGEVLYRKASTLGLHDGAADAFHELPQALQVAYGIFAETAWHTTRTLRRLAQAAADAVTAAPAMAEPGRGFSTDDEDDPMHRPGERSWR